jgi:hypothetical protein
MTPVSSELRPKSLDTLEKAASAVSGEENHQRRIPLKVKISNVRHTPRGASDGVW